MWRVLLIPCLLMAAACLGSATTASAPTESDAVRFFKLRAVGDVQTVRWAARDPRIDAASRTELLQLLEEHVRKVEAESEAIPSHPLPYKELGARAATLRREFDSGPLLAWRRQHPRADEVINFRCQATINIAITLTTDTPSLLLAVRKAGLPQSREIEATQVVEHAQQSAVAVGKSFETQQRPGLSAPRDDSDQLALAVVEADVQRQMFDVAQTLYERLQGLLTPDQYDAFDRTLPRPGW